MIGMSSFLQLYFLFAPTYNNGCRTAALLYLSSTSEYVWSQQDGTLQINCIFIINNYLEENSQNLYLKKYDDGNITLSVQYQRHILVVLIIYSFGEIYESPIANRSASPSSLDLERMDLRECRCADVLNTVYPQLVRHWRAACYTVKTVHFLSEAGSAAVTTGNHLQVAFCLSFYYSFNNQASFNHKFLLLIIRRPTSFCKAGQKILCATN